MNSLKDEIYNILLKKNFGEKRSLIVSELIIITIENENGHLNCYSRDSLSELSSDIHSIIDKVDDMLIEIQTDYRNQDGKLDH